MSRWVRVHVEEAGRWRWLIFLTVRKVWGLVEGGGGRAGRAPSPCSSIKSIPRSEKQQQKEEKQMERRSVTPTRCPWSCEPARWWTFPLCTFDCFQTRAPVNRGKTSENQSWERKTHYQTQRVTVGIHISHISVAHLCSLYFSPISVHLCNHHRCII